MAPPSLQEIYTLTRSLLTASPFKDPSILGAGRAALDLLPRDPKACLRLACQQLHAVPYREVKACWRRLYADAALWCVVCIVEKQGDDWVGEVVKLLDMALILTGAAGREGVVEAWFEALGVLQTSTSVNQSEIFGPTEVEGTHDTERPTKRRKLSCSNGLPDFFPESITRRPMLRHPVPRARNIGLDTFQKKMSNAETQTPIIIEEAIDHWPAFEDERAWKKPSYLMRKTLDGRRLVPVEIGRSYTDAGWGQKILSFRDFMSTYMLEKAEPLANRHTRSDDTTTQSNNTNTAEKKGYLAQHDLFAQIPSLRSDIAIPDYCYTAPCPQPTNPSNISPVATLEEPLLNAWFGPAGTISPLHTDPYHNILAQVVGYKYVRLYAPEQTEKMYPRGVEGDGIDMSNTSRVDLDEAMRVWGEVSCWEGADDADRACPDAYDREEFAETYPMFRGAGYVEGVLGPGECVYIPMGWWHYVASLTPSFSVSFWWN